MRILHVFHHANLHNGVDRTTLTLLEHLRDLGTKVSALVPECGPVTERLDALGVRYEIAPLGCCRGSDRIGRWRWLSQAASRSERISAMLAGNRVDLVHLNTGHLLDGALAAARAGIPAVWHIHAPFEVDYGRYEPFLSLDAYGWLLGSLGSHVIAVSEDVRASLIRNVPEARVSTLFNGIDVADIDRRAEAGGLPLHEELGLPPEAALVLGIGRISEQKDFASFVRVAARVAKSAPAARFAIAGPEEDRRLAAELRSLITDLDVADRVHLLGSRQDIPRLIASSVAMLSTARYEGQGLAALEAMSQRRPVVAMTCAGLRECIANGRDGVLVPPGDEAGAADALLRLLSEPDRRAALGDAARRTVEKRFSAAAYAAGFLRIAETVRTDAEAATERRGAAEMLHGLLRSGAEAFQAYTDRTSRPTGPGGLLGRLRGKLHRRRSTV